MASTAAAAVLPRKRHGEPKTALRLLAGAACCALARGQYGGTQFGDKMYEPPAPICPAFACPAGQVAAGKVDHTIWSYGCKDSGMGVYNMASFDPNNPYGQPQQKNLNKCCVERDVCKQTCGMTSKACHDSFQKCSKKICKGDQNCQLQAMMADIMTEPLDEEEKKDKDAVPDNYKYDPEESKCKAYKKGQASSCECVPKADFRTASESKLKSFYGKFNPEKLDDMGDIKDVDEVWKKWKGKEPDMFMALTTKYKDSAVVMKEKPKPKPYKPPPPGSEYSSSRSSDTDSGGAASPAEEAPAETVDEAEAAFKEKRSELETKKRKAKEEEDYDAAGEAKEELQELVKVEQERLQTKKKQAIEDEDFIEAKRIKQRLAKLAEL